ncbi:YbaK/EbsC family protein [Thalassiella azotivora]
MSCPAPHGRPGPPAALGWVPATSAPDLLAPSVREALAGWQHAARVEVAAIDPDLADTQALTDAYGLDPAASANCVVVSGRRGGEERVAACVVLATTRADVNGLVRRTLDVRKASFAPTDAAVAGSGMEYGGITPVGLPTGWRVLVDARVATARPVVVGSSVRRSKLRLPGSLLADLPGAEVLTGLGLSVSEPAP